MTRKKARNSPRASGAAKTSQKRNANRDESPTKRFERKNPKHSSKYDDTEEEEDEED